MSRDTDRNPERGTATYTRVFAAPRELVFRCMLEPEHLTHFWGPAGMSTPVDGIVVDPRPGGRFETVMVSDGDGSSYVMRASYDEIVEPERIAWTESGSGMRSLSTFVDLGDGRTEVTIQQTNAPAFFRTPEARAGFATSLDRFEGYLHSLDSAGKA
ncbi:MAG TPA: SRPBCC domain-containing protein [Frankiaceae bacterium]|nr:SRPBCC domain-containing protein [Frankiaceae bacterium]